MIADKPTAVGGGEALPGGEAARTTVLGAEAALRAWMFDHALPFWADAGVDRPDGGFHEHLALDGGPPGAVAKRVRVQARQVYVFSHAALLGWPGGLEAARHGWAFLRHAARPDGHWARVLSPSGEVVDATADLYDLAFVLFAMAWHLRAGGETGIAALARRTLGWVRATMAAPGGGLHNAWPVAPGHRQQNPHMHLLEATLALHQATGEVEYAAFAGELVSLFLARFFHAGTGTLGEFFDDALRPAAGEAGGHVEPGHHHEWVWLLDRYARQVGPWHGREAEALYGFAQRHGHDSGRGLVRDVLARDGGVRRGSFRLWVQCEAIKAHAAMLRRGHDTAGRIGGGVDALLGRYLARTPRGTWTDQLDESGEPASAHVPASSLYHLFMAYAELDSLARALG